MHCPKPRIQNTFFSVCLVTLVLFTANFSHAQNTVTNRALKLDGTNSYVQLPPNIFNDLTQATVEVWAKWKGFPSFSRVFEFGAGYHSMSLFNHSTSNDLRFNIYPRPAKNDPKWQFTAYARGLLRTNEWMHLAAVSGPGGMMLYANGRLVGKHTNTMTLADIDTKHTNVLGRGLANGPTDRTFFGEIDEVRVWDRQLTVAEIRENMFKRLSGQEDGLMHLWNFDDNTVRDSGPWAHHGKLMGKAR
ncbi:MAG TPA: LamG domain-containing protein, partial [Candidatus Acidoferrum sp.]|nr:LamG domain-containing protein [Candidatus Acidoferrum sp.]